MLVHNLFTILCFITFFLNACIAEWVDMPQFSDANKIYRTSSIQYDQFHKTRRDDTNNFSNDQWSSNHTLYRPIQIMLHDKNKDFTKVDFIYESTTTSNLFPEQNTLTEINENYTSNIDIVTEYELSNKCNTISPPKNITTSNILSTIQLSSNTVRTQETLEDKYHNDSLKQNDGILQYLPVDILKNVHHTLQSQPESLEGKMHFLKTFEKTLMTEIESRLAVAMAPNRKIRTADHHGYDDHDDHSMGFPSIEGALMAISFLTFAVYLVKLVMLLLRNMNNNMNTTTTATLFLGNRKRSVDYDDNTVRILSDMNTFVPDL